MGLWRNGNASDYESEDCRFDPCQARLFLRKGAQHSEDKLIAIGGKKRNNHQEYEHSIVGIKRCECGYIKIFQYGCQYNYVINSYISISLLVSIQTFYIVYIVTALYCHMYGYSHIVYEYQL